MAEYKLDYNADRINELLGLAESALQGSHIASGTITPRTGNLNFNNFVTAGDAYARANHVGEQPISSITNLQAKLDSKLGLEEIGTSIATIEQGELADTALQPGAPMLNSLHPGDTAEPSLVLTIEEDGSLAWKETGVEEVKTTLEDTFETHETEFLHVNIPTSDQKGALESANNPSISNPFLTKQDQKTVFEITGTSPTIDPDDGPIQIWTLTGHSSPRESFEEGQSILLMISTGSYLLDWSANISSILWSGGIEPITNPGGYTTIRLWKVGSSLYGVNLGDMR